MSVCAKCLKPVSRTEKKKIQCKACKGYFHWSCVHLTEAEVDVFLSSNTSWTCDPCVKKRRVSRSFSDSCSVNTSSSVMVTVEDIKGMLEEVKKEILNGQTNLETELGKSINHCQNLIADNNTLIEAQKKMLEDQQRIISCLQDENNHLHRKVKELSDRQTDLEQYSRRNTLEIFGIPEVPNESPESLKKTVVEVGAALGTALSEDSIDACHRIGGGNNRSSSGIIVKFLRRDDADKLLQKRKVKRDFSTRHLPGRTDDSPVYVNISLAPARRVLYAKARKMKTDFNYKYVWVDRAGRVKVRKSDDKSSRIIVIKDEDALADLVDREKKRSTKSE